jgi:hypothetical protein
MNENGKVVRRSLTPVALRDEDRRMNPSNPIPGCVVLIILLRQTNTSH